MLLAELAEHKNLINSIGVAFASLGAFLVWRYLTEINSADKEAYLLGEGVLTVPDPSAEDIRRLKRSMLLSKLGLLMILAGGGLQIISNHISS